MSKRKSFGRFTAMSMAGISAISAVSTVGVVANAEAYPTYVYEFTYGGFDTTQMYYSAIRATADNTYVKFAAQADAQKVFAAADGFKLDGTNLATDFWDEIDKPYNVVKGVDYNCTDRNTADDWQYAEASAFTAAVTPIVPEETYNKRTGSTTEWTFAFKSKAERDAAMSQIANANKSDYTTKYNAANSALAKDLTAAINTYKQLQTQLINDVKAEVNKAFKDDSTLTSYTITNTIVTSLDGTVSTTISKTEDRTAPDTTLTLNEWVSKQTTYVNEKVKELNKVATQAKQEFTEAYKPANWAFSYDAGADGFTLGETAVPFVSNYGAVEFGGAVGAYIKYSSAGYTLTTGSTQALDLTDDYYRTVGSYVNPDSYAFKGEIILADDREGSNVSAEINALLLDSDCWSQFSALIEGKPTDNDNTTETDKKDEEEKEEAKDNTTWYPTHEAYRISNSSNISYLGKNNYWYTSASAAELYGGGWTGTTKTSNYTDVKGSEKIYFNAVNGLYATKAEGSMSYLVETNEKKEETTTPNYTDPYYYYYMLGLNGTGNTTKVDPDAPTIYGSSKKSGWTRIASAVKTATSGGTITIDMNGATTIPEDVIKAAVSKDITLKAVNANGSIVTIDPDDVNYTTAVNVGIKYNTNVVSTSLKKKAIKANKGAVSTTQITVGEDGDLGTDITATVKLSAKRAGCTVKAYRLSSNGKKLTVEAKGTVKSNGTVNLKLDNGGVYLLVVID